MVSRGGIGDGRVRGNCGENDVRAAELCQAVREPFAGVPLLGALAMKRNELVGLSLIRGLQLPANCTVGEFSAVNIDIHVARRKGSGLVVFEYSRTLNRTLQRRDCDHSVPVRPLAGRAVQMG